MYEIKDLIKVLKSGNDGNEINAHAEYNRSYIQELENNKRDR